MTWQIVVFGSAFLITVIAGILVWWHHDILDETLEEVQAKNYEEALHENQETTTRQNEVRKEFDDLRTFYPDDWAELKLRQDDKSKADPSA